MFDLLALAESWQVAVGVHAFHSVWQRVAEEVEEEVEEELEEKD